MNLDPTALALVLQAGSIWFILVMFIEMTRVAIDIIGGNS